MSADQALYLMNELVWHAFLVAGPILIGTLIVGVLISILQVATQVQEITLSYVPKLLTAATILVVLGSWMLGKLLQFATSLYQGIPAIGG
ncbi:flagellar biosynthetic protein FliQ [Maricaulis sp. D1M11]|uniref:flagellar biosynthetic protein FliQ n=1 Tax=Maricaulis sp. D1M11 TaxID=3076117 RepID=UPI0039B5E898